MQLYPWHPYHGADQADTADIWVADAGAAVAADAGPALAASAPVVSAAALTTPMSRFRTLVDIRMQCSFRQAELSCSRLLSLNLRTSTDGSPCSPPEGAAGCLCLSGHRCDVAGSCDFSLAVTPHGTHSFPSWPSARSLAGSSGRHARRSSRRSIDPDILRSGSPVYGSGGERS